MKFFRITDTPYMITCLIKMRQDVLRCDQYLNRTTPLKIQELEEFGDLSIGKWCI